jgi:hypothetical protein
LTQNNGIWIYPLGWKLSSLKFYQLLIRKTDVEKCQYVSGWCYMM